MASQTSEVRQIFQTLEQWRVEKGYSQKQIASKIGISPSTYTKFLNGDIADMKVSVLIKICDLTDMMPFQLAKEFTSPQRILMDLISKLPVSSTRFLQSIAEFEYNFSQKTDHYEDYITVLEPTGVLEDGMYYDSSNVYKVNAKEYKEIYGSKLSCGIKITSNIFHPIYNQGDILLVSNDPPHHRQIGIFYNKKTKCVYLRKYYESNPEFKTCILEPIVESRNWKRIYVNSDDKEDMDQWEKFGYVLGKMR